ncbi:threonine-phosphate decarboxylase [Frigidibacter sp. ROC022]|uniref:threonine-phosphate decarboxylase n=1 Tax=Frigidibacter sp. ROC022 TaxID=2971796 RepID=UPI00215AA110|nr:threonine-phosphate decarboxylase [Frigidibacter sp. ROC022]MCR8724805.1 pyridoxal phosphate-dependent class II aminotransferase [Frigidibacter sp. ROC022]
MSSGRDHGGGLDAAVARFGGQRADWLDLSTGINPVPYPLPELAAETWTALPDQGARQALEAAARRFWRVPDGAAVLAAPGASALIARLPHLLPRGSVAIPGPTYNEHEAAFRAAGWSFEGSDAMVVVHPNNPDGRLWRTSELSLPLVVIDESFCDVMPERSLIAEATRPGRLVLKSFGKFWGLAGLRLGFAIGDPGIVGALAEALGPWPVSGPALAIGAAALQDGAWAEATRDRLRADAARLDGLMLGAGAVLEGGTPLFRLYRVADAGAMQERLARGHVWSRVFPWSDTLLRLGLPAPDGWAQLEAAL